MESKMVLFLTVYMGYIYLFINCLLYTSDAADE